MKLIPVICVLAYATLAAAVTRADHTSHNLFKGQCWVDDDTDFDFGQKDMGELYGYSSYDLRSECDWIAQRLYEGRGSSGVKDIVPVVVNGGLEGECWIDDDRDFDWGQRHVGKVYGQVTRQMREECDFSARERYGDQGSSGVRDIRVTEGVGAFFKGECWVDDDRDFDWGQKHLGTVMGFSSGELKLECADVARAMYGADGSSGVQNLVPTDYPVNGLKAQCWIDDDRDFDYGQSFGGEVYGRATREMRQECALIARNRYGDQGSSGLKDVIPY